jgi:hypothetical protein
MNDHPQFINRQPPRNREEMRLAMQQCEQTPGQSVLQHGESVWEHLCFLSDQLNKCKLVSDEVWRFPDWLSEYRIKILENLQNEGKLQEYAVYHDCGKPYCRQVDENTGRQHFPNHAEASAYVWSCVGGDDDVGLMIANDMVIHTFSAEEIGMKVASEWSCGDSVSLLLAALAEVHSNAKLFGGLSSTSFKMKWKAVERRGRQILKHWFPDNTQKGGEQRVRPQA